MSGAAELAKNLKYSRTEALSDSIREVYFTVRGKDAIKATVDMNAYKVTEFTFIGDASLDAERAIFNHFMVEQFDFINVYARTEACMTQEELDRMNAT